MFANNIILTGGNTKASAKMKKFISFLFNILQTKYVRLNMKNINNEKYLDASYNIVGNEG